MISPKEFLKKIEESKEFKQFKEKNNDVILANAFTMLKDWQLDYYSPKKDRVTSFTIENEKIIQKESELFRKKKEEILPLNLNNVKVNLKEALNKINQTIKENPSKIIIVLQVINKKPTWNITYLTTTFKTINFKINANSGEIISKQEASLLNINLGDLKKK